MSPTVPVASQAENDSASMSGSDSKKRNKLGYHRTSVACGHCRRRKIRCIPSNEPAEIKCQNCIRLKKECQFYPVDQNGANTRKSRSDSRAEPPAEESTLSRSSTSPDQPISTTSDSFDTTYGRRTSSTGTWNDTSGLVSSPPGRLGSLHNPDQQEWTPSSAHSHIQNQFSQPTSQPSANAGMYWPQSNDQARMDYQQQQRYDITTTSGTFSQEPQTAFHNGFGEARHSTGRQSFSGVMDQTNAYRHYETTFPEIERSMTMPVGMFNHTGMGDVFQTSPQLIADPRQFVYDQGYGHATPHHPQPWLSPTSPHTNFLPQYLPAQHDRKYPQFSG